MKLFSRKIGSGPPFVLMHGVFGSSDNLFTMGKRIAESGFSVHLLDARNHGQSPRNEQLNYDVMADDLAEYISSEGLENPIILGHSMGGKTVMTYAQKYENFKQLISVDIVPKRYPVAHKEILEGLSAIPIQTLKSRKEADEIFSRYVPEFAVRQFILKNIYRTENGNFDWRINVPVISKNMAEIGKEIIHQKTITKPILFIKGSDSDYIDSGDIENCREKYLDLSFESIEGANHWVHASKPDAFLSCILNFTKS